MIHEKILSKDPKDFVSMLSIDFGIVRICQYKNISFVQTGFKIVTQFLPFLCMNKYFHYTSKVLKKRNMVTTCTF